MGAHHASVFRYQDYRKEIQWLVEQVDQGQYEPLYKRVCEAIPRLHGEWPLGVHGDIPAIDEQEVNIASPPTSQGIGRWFLLVLAEYLQACPSPLGNWSVLNAALQSLGWEQVDCDLLFKGLPTSSLLKPGICERSPWTLRATDPYWFWLHPEAARSGWLTYDDICTLLTRLRQEEGRVDTFDVRQIPDIDVDNPVVLKHYKQYLIAGYRDTLAMLSAARELKLGLFMSIVVYA
jgi:hypothetical protein